MRCWHLKSCLQKAKDREDRIASASILRILHREVSKKRWRQVKYLLGKSRCGQVLSVKVDLEDGLEESTEDLEDSLEESTHEFTTKEGCFCK